MYMIGRQGPPRVIELRDRGGKAKIVAALAQLAKARHYARSMEVDPWQFAIELDGLTALGLTTSDLRWLLGKGFVRHARETSRPGDERRTFESSRNAAFTKASCFVLVDGVSWAELGRWMKAALWPADEDGENLDKNGDGPRWDWQRRALYVGPRIVKQYRVPSCNQEFVLSAFQEEGWPHRIDDPLPPREDQDPKYRLHYTIHRLNHNQGARLIRFSGDGTGQGVCWDLIEPVPYSLPEVARGRNPAWPRDFVRGVFEKAAPTVSSPSGRGLG